MLSGLVIACRSGNATAFRTLLREEVTSACALAHELTYPMPICKLFVPAQVEGVYSFPIFQDAFSDAFLDELDGYYASGLPVYRPNSMNK